MGRREKRGEEQRGKGGEGRERGRGQKGGNEKEGGRGRGLEQRKGLCILISCQCVILGVCFFFFFFPQNSHFLLDVNSQGRK